MKDKTSLISNLTHGLTFATDADVAEKLITKYNLYDYLYSSDTDNINCLQAVINEWAEQANKLYATTQYEYNPIENYNRVEHYESIDKTDYGRKDAKSQNVKEAVATDFKTEHNVDTTLGVNTDIKNSHAKNEIRTPNLTDENVHKDSGYDNSSGTESSRDISTRTGTENTVAQAVSNYDESVGLENNNYSHSTGLAADNFDRAVGNKADNYREITGDPLLNYTEASGSDELSKEFDSTVTGNIGVMSTQQMIEMERKIIINVLHFYVDKFAKCFNLKPDGLYTSLYSTDW